MREQYIARRIAGLRPSGIRKFFDIAATMKEVISLGIGEPDFNTPEPVLQAGIRSLQRNETHYTSNFGTLPLRQALAAHLERLYGVSYDPADRDRHHRGRIGGAEPLGHRPAGPGRRDDHPHPLLRLLPGRRHHGRRGGGGGALPF